MRTLITTILTSTCLTFSCSQVNSAVQISSKLIIGSWKIETVIKNDAIQRLTDCEENHSVNFTDEDMTMLKYEPGTMPCTFSSHTNSYHIKGNTLFEDQDSGTHIYEIKTLNLTTLVLEIQEKSLNEDVVITKIFTKQKSKS